MEIKEINCPNCGAVLKIRDDADDIVTCEYCGNSVHVDTREDREKAYQKAKGEYDAKYEYEQKRIADEEKRNRQYKRETFFRRNPFGKSGIIVIGIILFYLIISSVTCLGITGVKCIGMVYTLFDEPVKDIAPFEYISVDFDGINGRGKGVVTFSKDMPYEKDALNVYVDGDGTLSNGDTVRVSVSVANAYDKKGEDGYHISSGNSTKEYTVEGLAALMQDCSELRDDHISSLISAGENITDGYAEDKSIKSIKPYMVYLAADPSNNMTYMTYEFVYTDKYTQKDETVYVPVGYKDVYPKSDGEVYFSYRYDKIFSGTESFYTPDNMSCFYGCKTLKGVDNIVHNNELASPKYSSLEIKE